jgi:hypothetical protein
MVWMVDLLIFLTGLLIWIGSTAMFVLPVANLSEWSAAFIRLLYYMTGRHGPAIHVKDGKIIKHTGEEKERGYGVVLVDANSAVILAKKKKRVFLKPGFSLGTLFRFAGKGAGKSQKKSETPDLLVKGPGLIFTGAQVQVNSAADLRPQVRARPGVQASTRDGIEVVTNVVVGFTLGQEPDILTVAYRGSEQPENLMVINLEPEPGARPGKDGAFLQFVVTAIVDELDEQDQQEMHQYIQSEKQKRQGGGLFTQPLQKRDGGYTGSLYTVDPARVFAAVYSQAQDIEEEKKADWTELPAHAAVGVFRNLISQEYYDYLYKPKDAVDYPLQILKNNFSKQVRNLGVLSFQYIERRDWKQFEPGQHVDEWNLLRFPSQTLRQPQVLRARGIKVLFASFAELKTVDPGVYQQRLENWRSHWEREALLAHLEYDNESVKILNASRAQAQLEIARSYAAMLNDPTYSLEAATLRVFQAMEAAANDPATRQLLPEEIIHLLEALRTWFGPEGGTPSGSAPSLPGGFKGGGAQSTGVPPGTGPTLTTGGSLAEGGPLPAGENPEDDIQLPTNNAPEGKATPQNGLLPEDDPFSEE